MFKKIFFKALIEAKKEVFLLNNENLIDEEETFESCVDANNCKMDFTYDANYIEEV